MWKLTLNRQGPYYYLFKIYLVKTITDTPKTQICRWWAASFCMPFSGWLWAVLSLISDRYPESNNQSCSLFAVKLPVVVQLFFFLIEILFHPTLCCYYFKKQTGKSFDVITVFSDMWFDRTAYGGSLPMVYTIGWLRSKAIGKPKKSFLDMNWLQGVSIWFEREYHWKSECNIAWGTS